MNKNHIKANSLGQFKTLGKKESMMKIARFVCTIALIFLCSTPSIADDHVSFGLGAGALYNGIGANVAFVKDTDLKYASLGCIGIGYSSNNGASSNCGIGVGWMRSDILSETGNHGLGVHIDTKNKTPINY